MGDALVGVEGAGYGSLGPGSMTCSDVADVVGWYEVYSKPLTMRAKSAEYAMPITWESQVYLCFDAGARYPRLRLSCCGV